MKNVLLRSQIFLLALFAGNFFAPASGMAQAQAELTDKQFQALDKFMAPYRKKLNDIVDADKTGQYKKYQADLETVAKTDDAETRRDLLARLQTDHYDFIKKAYTAAKINNQELRRGVADILRHNNFTLDEFGGIRIDVTIPPVQAIPLKFDAEFNCPLAAKLEETNHGLLSFCTSNVTDCNIHLESTGMYDGGCRSKGSLGGVFELPQGAYHKITVSARYGIDYEGIAMALGGYAQANVKVGVRLVGSGYDEKVITKSSCCVAPLIWFTKFEVMDDNFSTNAVFSGNFSGGSSFKAMAYNETFALAIPLLQASDADCKSFGVDFVKVAAAE